MQLKDVTPIIKAIIEERDKIPVLHNTERYIPNWTPWHAGNFMRGGIRKALRAIEQAPVVDAVPVVRCRECKHAIVNHNHVDKPLICCLTKMVGTTDADWFCAAGEREMDGGAADGSDA